MKKQFWDHSSKPSVFVEVTDGVETYRGPFRGATRPKEIEELRRERDEAREKIVALGKQINGLNIFANERYDEILRVRKERDEAREALAEALQSLECAVKDIFEMRQLIKEIRRDLPRM